MLKLNLQRKLKTQSVPERTTIGIFCQRDPNIPIDSIVVPPGTDQVPYL